MRYTSFSRTFIARIFLVCCVQVLFLLQCSGQSTLGSIFGTITDSSGAVVPEASITVTNVNQGTTRTAKTALDGTYRISQLAPGTYQVAVEHQGFAKSQSEQISLAIESSVRADLMLKPGNQSTTVEVSAANALMEVGSAEVSTQVTTQELHDLPSIDRNILGLMSLGPGTVAGNDTGRVGLISGAEVVAMGTPPVGNTFLLDGVATNMEFSGTVAAKPPMDTAAGFSTQIAQFPADLGRAAGAVLNMSIKSGTNKFHGSVYEYIQNDIANASNYNFQTVAQPVLPYRRNQFGANLGGPIIHDKAFFFVGWEGLHQLTTTRTQYTVPTAAEKNGDFRASGDFAGYAVYDPASLPAGATTGNRTRFTNDIIPASRITSIGKALMQWYPEPNYQSRFYLQDVRKTVDSNSWVGKVNFTINPRNSVDVHYVQQSQAWRGSNLNAAVSSTTTQQNGINTGINYIHIFSPALLNTLRLSYSRFYLPSIADNQTNYMNAIGIPGWANDPGTPGVPTLSVATMSAIQAYQAVSAFAINFKLKENNYQIQDLVNWQRGRHSFKIGAEYQQVRTWQFRTRTGGGNLTFNGTQTTQTPTSSVASPRDGVADALLALASGVTARYQLSNGSSLRSHYVMPYIQDDWRLTDRLTINLGLRYGIFTPYIVANDITWNFDPSTGTVIVPNSATSKAFFQNSLGFTNGLPARWAYVAPDQVYKKTQWNDFDPRIGFAYQVRPNIVWRGGFGLYHLPVLANTPMNGTADSNDYVPSISTGNPLDLTKGVPTGGLTATLSSTGFTPYFYPRNIPDPYSEKWTMDVQYSPTHNSLIGVGYLGANSLHFAEIYPFNQAPVVSTTVALGSRTPYPNFGQFYSYDQVDRVNYNAGTARFELNGFHGLLFKSYYTYAKALGIGTGNDQVLVSPYNMNYDYGRVDYDVKHRWTTTFVYRMPSPKDAGLWTKILSPWDLSGIINLQSGMPITVTDSGGTALNIGTTGGSGQRPQLLHNPNLPTDQRSKSKWFDTTAFSHVSWCTGAPADVDSYTTTAFAIGDATNPCRNITAVAANSRIVARTATTMAIPWGNEGKAVIDGPGQQTFNLAIQRRFLLPMESALTFRLEAINALNHPNLHAPSGLNFSGTNFGVILATQNPMRQLQASIRIDF
jgi:hypothetical protein